MDDDDLQTLRLPHSQQLARTAAAAADKGDDDDVGKETAKPILRWAETAGCVDRLVTDAVGSL